MSLSNIARGVLYAGLALVPIACGDKSSAVDSPSPIVSPSVESVDSIAADIDSRFVRVRDNQIDHLVSAHNYSVIPSFDKCDPCGAYKSAEDLAALVRDPEIDANIVKLRGLHRSHIVLHREVLPFYSGCDTCSLYSSMEESRDLVAEFAEKK